MGDALGRSDCFDHLVQTAFGPVGGVLVQQVFRGRLVDFLLRKPQFGLSGIHIASLDRVADAAKLSPQRAAFCTIGDA